MDFVTSYSPGDADSGTIAARFLSYARRNHESGATR
jgi:hypothetical protein